MDFINSNIVVVDGSTNQEDDLDEPLEKLPLPWIALSVRNVNLFVPTIHHVNPSLGLKYIMGIQIWIVAKEQGPSFHCYQKWRQRIPQQCL